MGTDVIDVIDSQDGVCLPDSPSEKDWLYADHCGPLSAKPRKKRDLRAGCSTVQTQGNDSSCVAQAVVSAIEFLQSRASGGDCDQFSRYFVYYNARRVDQPNGDLADLGTSVRSAIKGVAKKGVCAESLWPYIRANVNTHPTNDCYEAAELHELLEYYRLRNDTMDELRDCLDRGFPFVFLMNYGTDYPKGAEATGYVRVPTAAELNAGGRHAVMGVGYDDKTKRLTFMNSKGRLWGKGGFGQLDYEYVTRRDLCSDFWTIRRVEDIGSPGPEYEE
jgi:C1A family cysteine protease